MRSERETNSDPDDTLVSDMAINFLQCLGLMEMDHILQTDLAHFALAVRHQEPAVEPDITSYIDVIWDEICNVREISYKDLRDREAIKEPREKGSLDLAAIINQLIDRRWLNITGTVLPLSDWYAESELYGTTFQTNPIGEHNVKLHREGVDDWNDSALMTECRGNSST